MRKYVKRILEWLHILLLLMIIVPFVYMFRVNREPEMIYRLYFAGGLLLFPIVAISMAEIKCRKLSRFLLVVIGVFAGVKICAAGIGSLLFGKDALFVYEICMQLGTIIVAVETYALRMFKIRRRQAKEEQDCTWVKEGFLWNKPHVYFSVWFVAVYAIALNFSCPRMCNLALVSTVVYLLTAIPYQYINEMEKYLKLNDNVCNVRNIPYQRIFGIGRIFVIGYLFLILLALIPSILTARYRHYQDIRMWEPRRANIQVEADREEMPVHTPDLLQMEMGEAEPAEEMSPIWDIILKVIGILLIVYVVLAIIRWIQREFARFAGPAGEDEDKIEMLKSQDEEERWMPVRIDLRKTEEERIRRIYRKFIRKHRKERPEVYETPTEIETAAGVADTEMGKALHEQYETVRYGRKA